MHFPVNRLTSVVMITAFALTATAAIARDFAPPTCIPRIFRPTWR
jgi:hypothetical protein